MLANIVLIVSLATLAVSSPTQKKNAENELITTFLGSGTNIMREFSKLLVDDADKFSVDLTALYKKNEIAKKAEQAKKLLEAEYEKFVANATESIKKSFIQSEEKFELDVTKIKKYDPVLGEKYSKFSVLQKELHRIIEDLIQYELDPKKVNGAVEKFRESLYPVEHNLADSIKTFEAVIHEILPKHVTLFKQF